jgi:hypothetical protein
MTTHTGERRKSMAQTSSPKHNPALKQLEILVGDWEMELSHVAFLPHPSDTAKGQISFEWVENGAFLRMRLGDDATWLISRDDSQPDYKVFYYDSRSVSRIYEMSFSENRWKIWRNSPHFSQRYEGKISCSRQMWPTSMGHDRSRGMQQEIPASRAASVPLNNPRNKVIAVPIIGGLHHDYRRRA